MPVDDDELDDAIELDHLNPQTQEFTIVGDDDDDDDGDDDNDDDDGDDDNEND